MDSVEQEYLRAIELAAQRGKNDLAYELSIGLQQYRKYFKVLT